MKSPAAMAISIGSVTAAALVGGRFGPQTPGRAVWYGRLRKPSYTPPGVAICVAWTLLDLLLCVSGYRLLVQRPSLARDGAICCWAMTLAGLAGFPAVFFARKRLDEGTAVAAGMLAAAVCGTLAASRVDRPAAAANVPLVLWTAFATLLSEELWRRNRRPR